MGRVAASVSQMTATSAVSAGDVGGGGALDAEGDAHGGGDADGHGAADDHVADDGGDLLVVGGEDVGLFEGELGLVEEVDAGREPFEGGNHVSSSLDDLGQWHDGGECGAVGCSRGVEALAAADATDRAEGEEIEEPVLGAATMRAMDGLRVAEGAELSVGEDGFFGKHGVFIGCAVMRVRHGEDYLAGICSCWFMLTPKMELLLAEAIQIFVTALILLQERSSGVDL